ncbi:hypothetical protein LTR37_007513 [Vermiconidia calcicola]|uniref:Uncharacterized protein n=1 Tax=Vermiconidia calcicola TaxID=1690605 RepID=A0ACC3NDF6_9PEZI|nr:hypothetical protein LTR37_007513 [Vermiconidia calcicola]
MAASNEGPQRALHSEKMESVGGDAEELVPDEYGILLSMILRQYFLSLQVLAGMGDNSWGTGMAKTWGAIGAKIHQIHPLRDDPDIDPAAHDPAAKGNVDTYSSDDEDAPMPGTQPSVEHGRHLAIMRKTLRRWRNYAGCEGDAQLATSEEEKYEADWTKGISPMLDGRIKMIEEAATSDCFRTARAKPSR